METTTTLISTNELTATEAAFAGGFLGSFMVIGLIVAVLLIIAGWKIFEKAGEKGWKALIPIYDIYIFFKICGMKSWFWGLLLISLTCSITMAVNMPKGVTYIEDWAGYHMDYSLVEWGNYPAYLIALTISCMASIVAEIVLSYKLAKAFGKGIGYTLGLIFFPYIFTMILGFGKAKYNKKLLK